MIRRPVWAMQGLGAHVSVSVRMLSNPVNDCVLNAPRYSESTNVHLGVSLSGLLSFYSRYVDCSQHSLVTSIDSLFYGFS